MLWKQPPYLPYVVTYPSLGGLDDEAKAKCIWCGTRWYAIHHHDGVCRRCIDEGMPTLTIVNLRQKFERALIGALVTIVVLIAMCFML